MSAPHIVCDIRTSKSVATPNQAVSQLFAALPHLRNQWWHQALGHDEQISFEFLHWKQTLFTLSSYPERLHQYMQSVFAAAYPQAVLSPLPNDPLAEIVEATTSMPKHGGFLRLQRNEQLPLKTFSELSEADALTPLFSTFSGLQDADIALVQFCVGQDSRSLFSDLFTSFSVSNSSLPEEKVPDKSSNQSLKASIRVLAIGPDSSRANQMLSSIEAAFQPVGKPDGNELGLSRPLLGQGGFIKGLLGRKLHRPQRFTIDELATICHFPNEVHANIPNIAWGRKLLGEPPAELPIVSSDSPNELKQTINVFARTTFKNQPVVYGLAKPDRRRHFYVIGKTGTGKSTMLANMAINDLKNNEGICVIDPHGDLIDILLNYIPKHRINDVVYFDPGATGRTVKLNLFEGNTVAHRELIASGIVSVFHKLYAYSWGPRLEYILRNTLLTLLHSPTARLSDVTDLLTDKKFRMKVLESLNDPILRNFWENEFDKMPDRQRTEAVAPILNKVGQFVTSPIVRDVVNARKSSFSIEEAMNSGKIILANLSQGKLGEDNATLLGAMLITKIQLAAMARVHAPEEDRRDFYLYVDEFQNFATESFNKILSEARKYRLNLTLANQYIAQVPEEVQKAIFGNCGSIASFVMGAEDAELFSREFNHQYTTDELVSLGKHQIINKITIDNVVSNPFPANTLPLAKSSNSSREKVIAVSRERYSREK
ncbi:MAG: DUF87 domain-containing protein [Patescibacteria group bacterium]